MAKLHFKYGAMNSGKSDTLIKNAHNYTEQGLDIATIKPGTDTKKAQHIIARTGFELLADIIATPEMDLRKEIGDHMARDAIKRLHCVLVDEAQFLDPVQIDQLHETAKLDDISVIAYGLRTDFRSVTFPGSKRLLELADNIEKIPTMCRCGSQAEFNCRKINGKFVFEGAQVAIDGEGETTYDSLCGGCWRDEIAASIA